MNDSQIASNADNDVLIDDHIMNVSVPRSGVVGQYLILKVLLLLLFSIFSSFKSIPVFSAFFILIGAIAEFWLIKNKFGLSMVGMRWSHEIGDAGDPRWVFYARPDPYIPDTVCLRVFWSGIYGGVVVWTIIFFIELFQGSYMNKCLALILDAMQYINLACFLKCNKESERQADDIARSVMLGAAFDSDNLEPEVDDIPEITELNYSDNQQKKEPEENVSHALVDGVKDRKLSNPRLVLPQPKTSNIIEPEKETKQHEEEEEKTDNIV